MAPMCYFSERIGKLGKTIQLIQHMLVKKLFTVHILVIYRALILFEKRDSHSELSLEGDNIEQKQRVLIGD